MVPRPGPVGSRRLTRSRTVARSSQAQPVALFGGQARLPDPVPVVVHAGTAAILPGQHRDDVDVIVAVPDRHPSHGIVVLTVG